MDYYYINGLTENKAKKILNSQLNLLKMRNSIFNNIKIKLSAFYKINLKNGMQNFF